MTINFYFRTMGQKHFRYQISNLIISLLLFIISTTTFAGAEWDFSASSKSRCSEGEQQKMNACLAEEYKTVDIQLNALYTQLLGTVEDPKELKKAQSAWLRFRDLNCDYVTSGISRDGSLYPFALRSCYIDMTNKRIRDFKQYIEWNCNGCPLRK